MPFLTHKTPETLKNARVTIDDHNLDAINSLQKIAKEGFQTLLILGGVGTGKTHLARTYIPHSLFIDEATAKQYLVAGDLRMRPVADYACNWERYPLECLVKMKTVIYDDLGVADLTPAYIEKMLFWINERLDEPRKQTVFTTNLTIDELMARDRRIASRILQNALILELKGPDRRQLSARRLHS